MKKKFLFLVNAPRYFISHRLPIAKRLLDLGHEVHVASSTENFDDTKAVTTLIDLGVIYHNDVIRRGDSGWLSELRNIVKSFALMRRTSPDLVHLITLKQVTYGSVVARLCGIKNVVAAIAGVGSLFVTESKKSMLMRLVVVFMMKFGLKRHSVLNIFQNETDRSDFENLGVIFPEQARLIRGSGVRLDDYSYEPEPVGIPVVVMAARLIKEKGVIDFVEAANILAARGIKVEMRLLGEIDRENPSSLSAREYRDIEKNPNVLLLGHRDDISIQYRKANLVCLPSYREGLPKSLIEASACGRPIITTDVPGCRDAIVPEITGVLVPVRDPAALANAIERLIVNDSLRLSMGFSGRKFAEEVFDIYKVVDRHIEIYEELLGPLNGK